MTSQLEAEVALPLAAVQQSLAMQVAFWDNSRTLSSAVMGLYVVPTVCSLNLAPALALPPALSLR